MAKIFLFLEIYDPTINAFFLELNKLVGGKPQDFPVHVTVRGPYTHPIPSRRLDWCIDEMKHDVLRVGGAGHFSNPKEEVVYLKVDSPQLREIWRKPDFPITKFGYNPHISIYRGNDKGWASRLYEFLESHRIEILCAEFRLREYQSKQKNIDVEPVRFSSDMRSLEDFGRIPVGFMSSLEKLRFRGQIADETSEIEPVQHELW